MSFRQLLPPILRRFCSSDASSSSLEHKDTDDDPASSPSKSRKLHGDPVDIRVTQVASEEGEGEGEGDELRSERRDRLSPMRDVNDQEEEEEEVGGGGSGGGKEMFDRHRKELLQKRIGKTDRGTNFELYLLEESAVGFKFEADFGKGKVLLTYPCL